MQVPATAAAKLAPYLRDIAAAAAEQHTDGTHEDPYRVSGLILRESLAGWAAPYQPKGDPCGWGDDPDGDGPRKPWAFGLCQLDRRYHQPFITSPHARTPLGQFRYACGLLGANRVWLRRACPKLRGDELLLERAVYAAYNAGEGNVYHAVMGCAGGRDDLLTAIDAPTAHHDYSVDVFRRAEKLRGEHLFVHP